MVETDGRYRSGCIQLIFGCLEEKKSIHPSKPAGRHHKTLLALRNGSDAGSAAFRLWVLATLAGGPALANTTVPQPPKLDRVEITGEPGTAGERALRAGKLILGRRLLERSKVTTIREVLLRDPAISVSANGSIGLLGLPGYTEVLLDGEPPPLGLNPLTLPPAQVERIEIIHGNSADTGLGAIAGTINVVRRAQRSALPLEGSGEIGMPARNQTAQLSAQTIWKDADSGRTVSLAVNAMRNRSAASSSLKEWAGAPDGGADWQATTRILGRLDNLNLSLRTTFKLGEQDNLSLSTELLSAEVGTTTLLDGVQSASSNAGLTRPSQSIARWRWRTSPSIGQSLDWERQAEQGGTWQLRGVVRREQSLWETSGVSRWEAEPAQSLSNRTTTQRNNASLRLVRRGWVLGDHKLQGGVEVEQERKADHRMNGDGTEVSFIDSLFSPTAVGRSQDLGAWMQDDWTWSEDMSLKLGLRGVHRLNRLDEGPSRSQAQLRMLAPSLNATWMPGEEGNHALSLGLSRGFKLPAAQQLSARPQLDPTTPCRSHEACSGSRPQAPDRAGNPALQPERSWGLDLTLESNVREHSAVSVGLAWRWIDQLVAEATRLESVPWSTELRWVLRPVNLGRARSHAINFGFSLVACDWLAQVPKSLELTGAMGWAGSSISTVPGRHNRLPDQTPFTARLGLKYEAQSMPFEWRIDGLLHPTHEWQDASGALRRYSVKRAWSLAGTWSFSPKQQLRLKASNLPGETQLTDVRWPGAGLRTREETRTRPELSVSWTSRL
jgi:outer membrane receptor for ferrienterochelin and colicins